MSLLSKRALAILEKKSPLHKFAEEMTYYKIIDLFKATSYFDPIFLSRTKSLFADIYDKTSRTIYEIDGQQHYKFNTHFHKTIGDFESQQRRDRMKREIAQTIGAELVIMTERDVKRHEKADRMRD